METAVTHDPLLAVHSLDRFDVSVPDLEEAARFYTAFGLDVRRSADGLYLQTFETGHAVCRVARGERKKLLGLRFGIYAEDVSRFADHMREAGVDMIDAGSNGALRLRDPDGLPIELVVGGKTSPSAAGDPRSVPRTMAPKRSKAPFVRPRRFSHILLFSADVDRAVEFYSRVLGLRLSDRSANEIAFMHTPHGSDHHLVAFVKSEGPGLHHSSWDVRSLDDVGLGARQLAAKGYDQGWGVGRHVLGSNYFYYAKQPWGGYCEYSFDMDFIAQGSEWATGDHDGEDAFFVWGPQPPEGFASNTELG
jgi:catechol 2,3-dioxygenase-like lactoylglutathione lyase family enzyme